MPSATVFTLGDDVYEDGTSAEFKTFIDSEGKQWGAIIKKVGISID